MDVENAVATWSRGSRSRTSLVAWLQRFDSLQPSDLIGW